MRNEVVEYLNIQPGGSLPDIQHLQPFRAVVVIEAPVLPEWQEAVSTWLVTSGCRYMMAWGNGCSSWDDSVDIANLEAFDYQVIPEDKFVMTTWHENKSLPEVFWFSKHVAQDPIHDLKNTVILHIATTNKRAELEGQYEHA